MRTITAVLLAALALPCFAVEQHVAKTEELKRQLIMVQLDGICSAVMQKNGASPRPGRYVADNRQLHQCQYIQEMVVGPCLKLGTCPSYEEWARANKDFAPELPRNLFEAKLDQRQAAVQAVRKTALEGPGR